MSIVALVAILGVNRVFWTSSGGQKSGQRSPSHCKLLAASDAVRPGHLMSENLQ